MYAYHCILVFFKKNLQFNQLSCIILNFMIYMLTKIFVSTTKYLHMLFQLYSNSICMPIIVSNMFSKNFSILSVILGNQQFYHAYFIQKSSFLSGNISTSLFNYILIVFVCCSLYLSFFPSKSSILSIILYNPSFYHTC